MLKFSKYRYNKTMKKMGYVKILSQLNDAGSYTRMNGDILCSRSINHTKIYNDKYCMNNTGSARKYE